MISTKASVIDKCEPPSPTSVVNDGYAGAPTISLGASRDFVATVESKRANARSIAAETNRSRALVPSGAVLAVAVAAAAAYHFGSGPSAQTASHDDESVRRSQQATPLCPPMSTFLCPKHTTPRALP